MTPPNTANTAKTLARGLLGAAIGGCVGHFLFQWILRQGFHAIMVPPALLGGMAGLFAGRRSQPLAIGCAMAGLLLGLFTEWRFFIFGFEDSGFLYFLTHLYKLNQVVLGLLALGTFLCYRLALGRDQVPEEK